MGVTGHGLVMQEGACHFSTAAILGVWWSLGCLLGSLCKIIWRWAKKQVGRMASHGEIREAE